MKKKTILSMPRRTFIASGMLLGNSLFGIPPSLRSAAQAGRKAKETLSPDEKGRIDGSTMAKDLQKYFGQDFSCAESLLLVALRYLEKPEDRVWAAAGFGGGMYNRDLCGFLTGGIISLGIASGTLKMPRNEAKKYCSDLVRQYWKWWGSQAPYHCAEIRTSDTTSSVCVNLGLLSAAKIEEWLGTIKNKA
jgi:hypothetical protein